MVMAIDGLSDLGLTVQPAAPEQDLGQDDFLHLMITQLKNQDPFKPLESGEFLGQLAQFGTVSGLAGLQTSFDSLATSLVSNQALQASTLVGRSALAETSALDVAAGQTVSGAVDLPAATAGVTITISDFTGQPVRTITLGAQPAGLASFSWDGLGDGGESSPAGRYFFDATYHTGTESVAADMLLRAPIDSVLFGATGFTVELRGVGELPFSAVREIRNETVPGAAGAAP